MQAELTRVGDDLALILDRSTWNDLGLDVEAEWEVAVDESGIHIRPRRDAHHDRLPASTRRIIEVHEETFRKLAR